MSSAPGPKITLATLACGPANLFPALRPTSPFLAHTGSVFPPPRPPSLSLLEHQSRRWNEQKPQQSQEPLRQIKIQTWQLVFLNLPAIHLHSPHIWRSLSRLQRFSPSALSCRHLRLQAQLVWRHRRAPLDLHASTVWWSLEVVDPKGKSYYSNEEDIRLVCVLYPS
uniref:Uncharacterized protein n=1 Tax=Oryza nivara TaxID=4536 RepID=A0A0E0HN09_ORYNI